ncbi:MAG: FliP family, partial [Acidimicrobiales bacterium]|nr:FliP family [Acidimicrobiales bacterium]
MSTLLRRALGAAALALLLVGAVGVRPAAAQTAPPVTVAAVPTPSVAGADATGRASTSINLDLGASKDGSVPSQSIVIILLLTLLSVAPALLIMLTSFTRIVVVLSL